jgi:uncharacterized membrane protein
MNTLTYLKLYLTTLVIFFLVDMFWLGFAARGLYRKYLGHLLAPQANWIAAIIFYLLFIVGLLVFAILPGLQSGSLGRAALLGALFGFFTYATYDLTNYATLRDWPLTITLVDIAWGVTLSTLVSSLTFLASKWVLG